MLGVHKTCVYETIGTIRSIFTTSQLPPFYKNKIYSLQNLQCLTLAKSVKETCWDTSET